MEIDIVNISDVLREVIAFLECLHDVQLPLTLESLREKLLTRSKDTLSIATMPRTSPEPYLDMNSGPKSLLLRKSEADLEEYVGMEGSKKQNNHHQDYYYETFENEGRQGVANDERRPEQNDEETDEGQTLIRIYKNLSAAQIKSKCHKCGPLFKKEGRKLFLSESRACWIALVGSHLLIYRTERHNRPYAIYPIRGYMARPAPNLIPRDRQKSESAFEMYRPGNETLRFIARTPKDMEQWITKICEVGCGGNHARSAKGKAEGRGRKRRTTVVGESPTSRDEIATRYRDDAREPILDALDSPTVKGESASDKDEEVLEAKRDPGANPPPLPARIPRRLPSLPPDDAIPSYRAAVEDDDDDDEIYHKIEDLRNGTRYQNMMLSRKQRAEKKRETVVAYDDVRAPEEGNNEGQTREKRSCDAIPSEEMYDDVIAVTRSNAAANSERQNHDRPVADGEEEREKSYDDVENLLSGSGKFTKDRAKDQTEMSSKSPQKKSFLGLGRVLSRKESSGKSSKKYKGKTSSSPPPSSTKEETPIYDDASDVMANYRESLADEGEELPEYNCPPPPRPVYTNSTTINGQVDQIEDLYDDVSACREQYKNQMQTSLQSAQESGMKTRETPGDANTELEANDDDPPREEIIEHYQSPRSDLCVRDIAENQQQDDEKLYDDVALLRDFTARQRDITEKRDANEDTTRSTISPDKRSWNRFAAINRKSRASDSAEDLDDSCEGNGACSKRNTFQKLISRVENSLAKVSSRGNPSSLPTGKSSTASSNS